jgi:phospholipid/cholesterol/gamma-HCH transport system permease protein
MGAARVERTEGPSGIVLRLFGTLTLEECGALWTRLKEEIRPGTSCRVDLSGVERMDGAASAMLHSLKRDVEGAGGAVEWTGGAPDVSRLLDVYSSATGPRRPPTPRPGFLGQLGDIAVVLVHSLRDFLAFVGDLVAAVGAAARSPRTVQWADIGRLMERAGADGVPIVLLINFLVGAILAIQSAPLLARYGANIFVADLVAFSVVRELGPLMTAIIVCGRSGAAYAAELGTMKVSEEIDALRTLGLDPQRFLVIPRVIALSLMVPILTLLADAVATIGGALVAAVSLDITPLAYWNQIRTVLDLWDVFGGILKAAFFAATITLISCQRGLSTRGGAAGVGSSTTSAVVTVLFSLVLLDMVFAMVFNALGI